MIKQTIIIAGLFYCAAAYGADSTKVRKPEPPIRLFYKDGGKLPPQEIPIIHEMDCDENGWRFDTIEWEKLKQGWIFAPEYDDSDSEHGSNHGIATA